MNIYTNDYKAIRANAMRANAPKPKEQLRIASTVHPDTEDFNEAAMHRRKELDKLN